MGPTLDRPTWQGDDRDSPGVKTLDLREGSGERSKDGALIPPMTHKDETGDPMPFVFTVGSGKKSMRVGGLRRVIIPPSQGYQNSSQEPIPPNFFDRQRLFTTVFNPTRLANGEGSTLGTLIFDIELINIRQHS
ncbi:hypothetical protein U9M48_025579 [Paspalum notatum var. saurae]|uniref:Rotamase n=1 Tax=Paspalum notatum var. saurae TaxID=547442 RepID=A0AAQ3TTI8_PASNO